PNVCLPTYAGRSAQPPADRSRVAKMACDAGLDNRLGCPELASKLSLANLRGELGKFTGSPIPQQSGEEQLTGVDLSVAETKTNRAVGFGRFNQTTQSIEIWAVEGLLQTLK